MKTDTRFELRRYSIGAVICAALTLRAFWAVMEMQLSRTSVIWVTGMATLVQIVVQLRCILHLSWRNQKRGDIQLSTAE